MIGFFNLNCIRILDEDTNWNSLCPVSDPEYPIDEGKTPYYLSSDVVFYKNSTNFMSLLERVCWNIKEKADYNIFYYQIKKHYGYLKDLKIKQPPIFWKIVLFNSLNEIQEFEQIFKQFNAAVFKGNLKIKYLCDLENDYKNGGFNPTEESAIVLCTLQDFKHFVQNNNIFYEPKEETNEKEKYKYAIFSWANSTPDAKAVAIHHFYEMDLNGIETRMPIVTEVASTWSCRKDLRYKWTMGETKLLQIKILNFKPDTLGYSSYIRKKDGTIKRRTGFITKEGITPLEPGFKCYIKSYRDLLAIGHIGKLKIFKDGFYEIDIVLDVVFSSDFLDRKFDNKQEDLIFDFYCFFRPEAHEISSQ